MHQNLRLQVLINFFLIKKECVSIFRRAILGKIEWGNVHQPVFPHHRPGGGGEEVVGEEAGRGGGDGCQDQGKVEGRQERKWRFIERSLIIVILVCF